MIEAFFWVVVLILTILTLVFEIKVNKVIPNNKENLSIMDYILTAFMAMFAIGMVFSIIMVCVMIFTPSA